MLLGLAPWGPPVPTLYLIMNTICRLLRALGQMPSSQSPMANPSNHLSHFVSEEKEGQAEHGKARPRSQVQASSLRPDLFNTPAQCLLLGYDVTNK